MFLIAHVRGYADILPQPSDNEPANSAFQVLMSNAGNQPGKPVKSCTSAPAVASAPRAAATTLAQLNAAPSEAPQETLNRQHEQRLLQSMWPAGQSQASHAAGAVVCLCYRDMYANTSVVGICVHVATLHSLVTLYRMQST